MKIWNNFIKKRQNGFTLVELLVVIAILAILVVGLITIINPVDKINAANDTKVFNDFGLLAQASEAYATSHAGFYPAAIIDLVNSKELKAAPAAPSGYSAYVFTAALAGCTAGQTCASITITSQLKSGKYTATPFLRYESPGGKTCQVVTAATPCP